MSNVPNDLLGHPYFVIGEVIHGDKRGASLGFPTANLRLDREQSAAPRRLCGRGPCRRLRFMAASPITAAGRPSTMARRCLKSSCSISPAISMARRIEVAFSQLHPRRRKIRLPRRIEDADQSRTKPRRAPFCANRPALSPPSHRHARSPAARANNSECPQPPSALPASRARP